MASKVAEDNCNTETEEGTIARQKKRSRRVSFAENTSIHVFDRDDEYETPPEPKPSSNGDPKSAQSGFPQYSTDGEDSSQNEEKQEDNEIDELDDGRRLFFRPFESPSPGSTIGSATSNDEDNFFGPVSASFIRPGRLSDSAASDDNHDITMDSTAFSMHFRSLARSESGGDLKTPTGVHLSFEEKTPTQNTLPTNVGSSMVLTIAKKPISESSASVDKLSGSTYSNDMSLVEENPNRYDYGRLSPGLDALLAEGSKDLHAVSVSDKIAISKSIMNTKSRFSPSKKHSGPMELNDNRDIEMGTIDASDFQAVAVIFAEKKLDDANGGYNMSPLCQISPGFSSDMRSAPASAVSIDKQYSSPTQLSTGLPSSKSKESDALEIRRPNSDFDTAICGTPSDLGRNAQQIDVFASSGYESPLARSMSSLSAKQRQIASDSASPSKNLRIATPSPKQPGSFVTDETTEQSEIVSSIQKSISKLKMLNASPFPSTCKVNICSTLISSDIFNSTSFNTALDRDREDAQIKCVDTSVACSEDQLFLVGQGNGEPKFSTNMDVFDIRPSENNVDANHAKSSTGVAKVGISPGHFSMGVLYREQPIKQMEEEGLLSQITWSGNKMQRNRSSSGDPTKEMIFTSSSLTELNVDRAKVKKATGTPHRTVPSSEKNMEKTSLASEEYWGSFSRDLRLYDQVNKITSTDPGHDSDSRENVRSASVFATNIMDSSFMDRAQSSSPINEINHSKESRGLKMMDGREIGLRAVQDESGAVGNFQTPLTDKEMKRFQSMVVDGNLKIGTDQVRFKELTAGGVKASFHGYDSPFVHRGNNELPSQKQVVELVTLSPSRKEHRNVTHNDGLNSFVVEDVLSPTSYLTDSFENLYARKRRREDVMHRDSELLDEIAGTQRSPKHHRGGICDSEFLSEQPNESNTGTSTSVRERSLEHWADVFSNFSAEAKQLISPSTDKLNLQAIGALEDVLVNLQGLQICEMLCTEIRSQKFSRNPINLAHSRIAETKLLLHRILHEQAKLQLMYVKRERLLKKLQLLSSGIQESQMLKLNSLPRLSVPCARDAHVDSSHCQSVNIEGIQEEEGALDKVTALRKVLDDSERKVMSLSNSLLASFKNKGQPNRVDTVLLVNDHLKKKACCRFIRLDMQLWDVDNLANTNGLHNIVLNYHGFITQRFTLNVGLSSIVISNESNEVEILKNFPNMDICTAFAFVLNANSTRKYAGSRSLTQETQITSSVLGNLLDVVEEVQVARVELQNLTYTNFHSPSVEQLQLHLHFINFKSGRKAALTLDLSCLKWGLYPSEAIPIIPSQLEGPADLSRKSLPEPQLAEIRAAVHGLRVGYSRIIRLCSCVSEVVQAWSG